MVYPSRLLGVGVPPAASLEIAGNVAEVAAAGATQGTATLIPADHNIVTTAAASTGVILPPAEVGAVVTVKNLGANAVLVYPAVGGAINALAANAGFSVAAAGQATFVGRLGGLNWVSI